MLLLGKCNLSYKGESSRCLENRVEVHNSHVTSAIYKLFFQQPPQANISHFTVIDKYSKQVIREVREALHIRINSSALNHNKGKCTSQKFSMTFFEQMDLPMTLTQWEEISVLL